MSCISEKKKKEILLILFFAMMGLIKQFLVCDLPIMAVPKGIHDDWLMVHLADTLRKGQWLGTYNDLTLTKGMFFPLYLAVCNLFKLSYLNVTALFYTVSCAVFVYALRPVLKKYRVQALTYTLLLWSPISYSLQAFQRVYRNSISYCQVLLIFGGFLALYLRRKEPVKKHIFWMVTAAVGLTSFYYTREDAIWILPFLLVFTAVYLGNLYGCRKETKQRQYVIKAIVLLMPFLCLWGSGKIISVMNEKYYETDTINELQDGGFSEMYKSMMAVKPEEDIPGVTMTSEKIARMCEVCPTLKELEPYIKSSKELWAGEEGDADSWEVRDGWVFWIFRTALAQAGYYENGAAANDICLKIRDELEEAMDAGLLERQATMPSTYMSPWRKGYLADLFGALADAIVYTTTYEEMETVIYLYSEPDENGGNLLFERITGDKTIWYESDMIQMSGWYVSYDGMEGVTLQAEDGDGNVLETAEFTQSNDVKEYLLQSGYDVLGSDNCRFYLKFYVDDETQPVYLKAYRDGELLNSYECTEEFAGLEGEDARLTLDWYWDVPERHGLLDKINYKGDILNSIKTVYQYTGVIAAAAGVLAYLYVSVRLFIQCVNKKAKECEFLLERWLIVSALLGSYLVLLAGISYSEISGWNAILYWYLSGAYPVILSFEVLAIIFSIQTYLKEHSNS